MKNKYKIFIYISLFAILATVLLLVADYFCYCSYEGTNKKPKPVRDYIYNYKNKTEQENFDKYIYDKIVKRTYRKIENENSHLKPIVLFGFSNVYGLNLTPQETISFNIGKITKRPVYNRAKAESSLNHMYYQLSNDDFYKIVKKPEIIFYFYSPKQFMLMNHKLDFCQHDIYYKLKRGRLIKYENIPLYKKSYLMSAINRFIFRKGYFKNIYYTTDAKLFETLLIESKKEAQKHWGDNIKFVIVKCFDSDNILEDKIFINLSKQGFVIFELKKFMKIKDKIYKDGARHSPLFWKDTAEVLVKEFNLN